MESKIHISVSTIEQFNIIKDLGISTIYINTEVAKKLNIKDISDGSSIYFSMPYIFRQKDYDLVHNILKLIPFKGVLIKNLEELSFIISNYKDKYRVVLDSSLYILNKEALSFYKDLINTDSIEYYSSYELNQKELNELRYSINNEYNNIIHSTVSYGKIPMMISANCINKTLKSCNRNCDSLYLQDRMNKEFQVYCDCNYCYNVIYNIVPLSLHKYLNNIINNGNLRLDFTDEKPSDVKKIISYFSECITSYSEPEYTEYTTGHYKRGVE